MKKHDIKEGIGLWSRTNCTDASSATTGCVTWPKLCNFSSLYFLICKKGENDFYPMELARGGNSTKANVFFPLSQFLEFQLKKERNLTFCLPTELLGKCVFFTIPFEILKTGYGVLLQLTETLIW